MPVEKVKAKKISITCKCGAKSHYELEFRKHRVPLASERIPIRIQNIENLKSFKLNGFVKDVSWNGIGIKFEKPVMDSSIYERLKRGVKANAVIFPKGVAQFDQYVREKRDLDLIKMPSRIARYDKEERILGIKFNNPDEIYNQRFNKWFRFNVCELT
ncbi:MAG: hypothetical protein R6V41_11510 [Desulfobacteraceae bacterium]